MATKPYIVTDGPVIKDGLPMRTIRYEDGSGRVEVWKSKWIEGGDCVDMLDAPWMTRAELARVGIPFEVSAKYPYDSR